jgi:hypothetical protein
LLIVVKQRFNVLIGGSESLDLKCRVQDQATSTRQDILAGMDVAFSLM